MAFVAEDYYDIIANVNLISNLSEGWDFKCTPKGYQKYQEKKSKRACTK